MQNVWCIIHSKNVDCMQDADINDLFTSSWTHQQYVHDDQLFWCADRVHGDPSSDAYHDERESSSDVPNLHAILSRLTMMSAVNIYHQ